MRVALEEEHVLADQIRPRERRLDVAELERDVLVDVGTVAVLVDADLGMGERLLDRHERAQGLVLHVDQAARALRRLLVHRGDGGYGVAHHADLLGAERLLVLRGVDALDEGVAVRRAEESAVRHAWEEEVVGVLGFSDHLRPGVDLREGPTDDRELVFALGGAARVIAHRGTPIRKAASSTASRIFVYPVQRQRLPASASLISWRVGLGRSARSAWAVSRMPGVQ